jgi:SAM-dependent methyltransferase
MVRAVRDAHQLLHDVIVALFLLVTLARAQGVNVFISEAPNSPNILTIGDSLNVPFDLKTPVWQQTEAACATLDNESCQFMQDEMSTIISIFLKNEGHDVVNYYYTPTRPTATLEDARTSRTMLIQYLHHRFQFRDYLEIGCGDNESFLEISKSQIFAKADCVDPARGGTFRMTSDAYFASVLDHNRVHNLPNNTSFDLIFVDGMHSAEQVYRDVQHALALIRPGGIILMHDCNPRQKSLQIRFEGEHLWTELTRHVSYCVVV